MKRLWRMGDPPIPVGTRCFYENDALRLSGWGEVVAPQDDLDAEFLPILTPWRGTLVGPVDAGQVGLNALAPGIGVLPGEDRYSVVPAILLWVEDDP